jgi:hypothetical protein
MLFASWDEPFLGDDEKKNKSKIIQHLDIMTKVTSIGSFPALRQQRVL